MMLRMPERMLQLVPDKVAGLVLSELQHLPETGEAVEALGWAGASGWWT
jgi:hypothetical protein